MKNSERDMLQEAKDAKDAAKAEKAYNDASTVKPAPKKYAKGGSVRGDGIAQRGKTRGKMC